MFTLLRARRPGSPGQRSTPLAVDRGRRRRGVALEPLACKAASTLFGLGLLGAALPAAFGLPLSTAYSVCEAVGHEAGLDDPIRVAPLFYGTYATVVLGSHVLWNRGTVAAAATIGFVSIAVAAPGILTLIG